MYMGQYYLMYMVLGDEHEKISDKTRKEGIRSRRALAWRIYLIGG